MSLPPSSSFDLSVVVPLFNEQENLAELYRRLTRSLGRLALTYELIFVNDGSRDDTPALLESLQQRDPCVVALHLTRNFGHQAAICAGLDRARGEAVIVMDGDLQDPPELIQDFLDRWRKGYEVVYAVRTARKENVLKRAAYYLFYRLLRAVSDLDIPLDSGDFCLMDRKVVDVLRHLPERMRFVRGLRTFVGFRQIGLRYERGPRGAGSPKYTWRALLRLAIDGLVSFSSYPLNLVTYLGLLTAGMTVLLTLWVLLDADGTRQAPRGWASTIITILFTSTVQLISLSIIGEYIRRIFLETKGRPTYIVRESLPGTVGPEFPLPESASEAQQAA